MELLGIKGRGYQSLLPAEVPRAQALHSNLFLSESNRIQSLWPVSFWWKRGFGPRMSQGDTYILGGEKSGVTVSIIISEKTLIPERTNHYK